jgi:hypothetical protein
LVQGAFGLLATCPTVVTAVTDLLVTLVARNNGKDRESIVQLLLDSLCGPAADTATSSTSKAVAVPAAAEPLIPGRLLLLLMMRDAHSREAAAKKGMVARVLERLKSWQGQYAAAAAAAVAAGSSMTSEERKKALAVPVWVEAGLLLLEQAASASPRQASSGSGRGGSTSSAAAAAGSRSNTPATGAAAAGAAGGGDAAAAATGAGAAAPATPAAAALPPELAQLPGVVELVASWRPCGFLDDAQQEAALEFSIQLLQHLHQHAEQWYDPKSSMFEAEGTLPNPSGVTQALLQLLARLTKKHTAAMKVRHYGVRSPCTLSVALSARSTARWWPPWDCATVGQAAVCTCCCRVLDTGAAQAWSTSPADAQRGVHAPT